VLDAVGSDIRELAAVCSQLVADTDGTVDAVAVRRYHSGKAEVKGFDIADKRSLAMSQARRGVALVDDERRTAGGAGRRVGRGRAHHRKGRAALRDPYRLAAELGCRRGGCRRRRKQARRWSRGSIADAMRLVAALNADVKGARPMRITRSRRGQKVAELAAD